MPSGYFHRVAQETDTRFWINNPSKQHVEWAIAAGAVNCTTNPSYCSKLVVSDPDYIRDVIDSVVVEIKDDDAAAERVYHRAAARVMRLFSPLHEASGGTQGYVTIQGDPRIDEDPDDIIRQALRCRHLGKNSMAKIPVTVAGLGAIEYLVAEDVPVCATEVFSLAQAVQVCQLYQRATEKSGKHPPMFVTHITGIFDEYLRDQARRESIDIAPEVLTQAGCIVARKEYRVLKQRGYRVTMLGGGARGTQHFTEMVGGDMHITINWSTAQTLIEADGPVVSRIEAKDSEAVVEELSAKLFDFRSAYYEDGLRTEAFKDYGPVVLFRNMFLAGYSRLLQEIRARRFLSRA